MRIILDHREKKVFSLVKDIFPHVEVEALPLGDLLIVIDNQAVLVERKSIPDFVSSIRSNRLWEQLYNLLKARTVLGYVIRRKLLMIHGDITSYLENDTWRFWSSLAGALQEILFVYDTPIIFVGNDTFFSQFLRILVQREKEGSNDGSPKSRWYAKNINREMPVKQERVVLLGTIPGIGEMLANNLLKEFGTINKIATAPRDKLMSVEGIGKVKAEKIYDLFHN